MYSAHGQHHLIIIIIIIIYAKWQHSTFIYKIQLLYHKSTRKTKNVHIYKKILDLQHDTMRKDKTRTRTAVFTSDNEQCRIST